MSRILENNRFGIVLVNSFLYPVKIVAIYLFAEGFNIFKIIIIKTCSGHIRTAFFTAAHRLADNIKKNFARVVIDHYFFNLGNELVKISRVKAHQMIARLAEIRCFTDIRRIDPQPIVVLNRILFVKACRNIHGRTNSDFLAGFKLCLEKVEFQRRVHGVYLRRVI